MSESTQLTIALSVKNLEDNLPALLKIVRLDMTLSRAKYLAAIAQGFTAEQALELCKQPT